MLLIELNNWDFIILDAGLKMIRIDVIVTVKMN